MKLGFELLDRKKHSLKNFDCGKAVMNAYLKQFAFKNQKLKISKTWVVLDEEEEKLNLKSNVVAYFTLTAQHTESKLFSDKKLPNYPVPITLLARIAVDLNFQGKGVGKEVLFIALKKSLQLATEGLASYAVIIEVLDDKALAFYKKFSFLKKLDNSNHRLYVSMETLEEMFNP